MVKQEGNIQRRRGTWEGNEGKKRKKKEKMKVVFINKEKRG